MKRLLVLLVVTFLISAYAQDEPADKMELRNGQVLIGKVEVIKTDVVNFKEKDSELTYETAKKDIRYIKLTNGKILTFEDYYQQDKKDVEGTSPKQVQEVDNDSGGGADVGLIILATVGVVLGLLLIIGAAAQ